jgi:hypothetical protein
MSARIATTLAIAVAVAGTAANPACNAKGPNRCADAGAAVNLSSVPDIASEIVRQEPIGSKPDKPATAPAAAAPYTGPIFGLTSGKRAPTVGYSWSLE